MMGPQAIENLDTRLDAFEVALVAAIPASWTVERGFVPLEERADADLESVVLNLIMEGEGNYSRARGMAAKEGTTRLLLVAHLKVAENESKKTLQAKETGVINTLKAFTQAGLSGLDLHLLDSQPSRTLGHPYGWVVSSFELRPPGANTH
jgi:hypothetical protein